MRLKTLGVCSIIVLLCGGNVFAEKFNDWKIEDIQGKAGVWDDYANWEKKTVKEKAGVWDDYIARKKAGNPIVKYNPNKIQDFNYYSERPKNGNQLVKYDPNSLQLVPYNENTFLEELKRIMNLNQQTKSQTEKVQNLSGFLIDMLHKKNFTNLPAYITEHNLECKALIDLINLFQTSLQNMPKFINTNTQSITYQPEQFSGSGMPPNIQEANLIPWTSFGSGTISNTQGFHGQAPIYQPEPSSGSGMPPNIQEANLIPWTSSGSGTIPNQQRINSSISGQAPIHHPGMHSNSQGAYGQAPAPLPGMYSNSQGANGFSGKISVSPQPGGTYQYSPAINILTQNVQEAYGHTSNMQGANRPTQSQNTKQMSINQWYENVIQYKKTLSQFWSSLQGHKVKQETIVEKGKGCFSNPNLFNKSFINSNMLSNELADIWNYACILYSKAKTDWDSIKNMNQNQEIDKYKTIVADLKDTVEALNNTLKDLFNIYSNERNPNYINTTKQLTYPNYGFSRDSYR